MRSAASSRPALPLAVAAALACPLDARALLPGDVPPPPRHRDIQLSHDALSPSWSSMASDARGGAFIAWNRWNADGFSIALQHLTALGDIAWDVDGITLSRAGDVQTDPRVVADGFGGAIVTWDDFRSSQDHLYAARVDARGRSLWAENGVPVHDLGGYYAVPCADGAGGAFVTWFDAAGIYWTQHLDAQGAPAWRAPARLGGYGDNNGRASSLPDGAGGVFVCWSTAPGFAQQVYLQHVSAQGEPLWGANGKIVAGGQWQGNVELAPDGTGGTILAWQALGEPGTRIWAQRFDAAGVRHWNGDIAVAGPDGDTHYLRALCPDGAGGAYIVWNDSRGGVQHGFAQRIDHAGVVRWAAGGIPVASSRTAQWVTGAAADSAGGLWVVWNMAQGLTSTPIMAQHLRRNGRRADEWPAGGRPLTHSPGMQGYAEVLATRDGFVLMWEDTRASQYGSLFAHLFAGGEAFDGLGDAARASNPPPAASPGRAVRVRRATAANGADIEVALPGETPVTVTVTDVMGRVVRTLSAALPPGGRGTLRWDGRDAVGRRVGHGVYVVRVDAAGTIRVGRVVL